MTNETDQSSVNKNWLDKAVEPRSGEELPVASLQECLLTNLPGTSGILQVHQFPGGFSNLTYQITLGVNTYVLRRPPFGAKIKSGHDMAREFRILSCLKTHYHKVPTPLYFTEDTSIIGAPFYIMERIEGVILRAGMPKEMYPDAQKMRAISEAWLETLVELHAVDPSVEGIAELGRPEGYIERQILGWGKRYELSKTNELPKVDFVIKWLAANQPKEQHTAIIHNDFKYDNLILKPENWEEVSAVLDWEMATVGDPLMDLGTSLGYWINPNDIDTMRDFQFSPSFLPGNLTREEIVHQYTLKTGRAIDSPVFYYVYGLLKIAVIVQQIYYRYQLGLTKDERFGRLLNVIDQISVVASRAIERKKIDNLF